MFKALKLTSLAAAAALALGTFTADVNAAPVFSYTNGAAAYVGLVAGDSLNTGGGDFTPDLGGVFDSTNNVNKSPFKPLSPANVPQASTFYYTIASPGLAESAPSPVVLKYTSVKSIFSILWGSVDVYNGLEFFLGDSLVQTNSVGSIGGQTLLDNGATPGGLGGATLLKVSNILFDRVVFTSKFNQVNDGVAFEFAYAVAAVPLPAGALLLVTALGGFGVARRLRKAA